MDGKRSVRETEQGGQKGGEKVIKEAIGWRKD